MVMRINIINIRRAMSLAVLYNMIDSIVGFIKIK